MDVVEVGAVRVTGGILAITPLVARSADVDAFAILAACFEEKGMTATVADDIVMNVGILHKVAQADAFTTSIGQEHVAHLQPTGATPHLPVVGLGLTMHKEQFVAIVTGTVALAIVAVDRPAIQQVVVMEELKDAVTLATAMQHRFTRTDNGDWGVGRAVSFADQVFKVLPIAQVDGFTRLHHIECLLNRGQGIRPGVAILGASATGCDIPIPSRIGWLDQVGQQPEHQQRTAGQSV